MLPPSSLTTTSIRSGRSSPGPATSPLVSCRKVTSPSRAKARLVRGRARAAPIAEDTVPSMPARPRLATTIRCSPTGYSATIRSRSRTGLEAPTNSSPWGGQGGAQRARDVVRGQPLLGREEGVEAVAQLGVPAPPLGEPGGGGARGAGLPRLRGPGQVLLGLVVGPGGADDAGHPVPGVGPAGRTGDRDHLDVAARQQPGHRPGEGGVAVDHDLLDPAGELLVGEQQAVGADRVRAGARAAGGLREQRPAGTLGEHPRRRPGVVAGDHHGAASRGDGLGLRPRRVRGLGPGLPVRTAVAGVGPAAVHVGGQRVGELHVEVHRPRGLHAAAGRGDQVPGDQGAPGGDLVSLAHPVHAPRAGEGRRDVGEGADRAAEDLHLVGGLVGVGAAQARGPVGAEHDQRQPGVRGLEDGGVQVRHRGARGGHHRHRPARGPGHAEGEEAGRALVDPHVQPDPAGVGRRVQRERQRGGPGAGREHDVADPAAHELVDEHGGQGGRRVGGSGRVRGHED